MKIKHYDIKPIPEPNPQGEWRQAWYGLSRLYEQVRPELESTFTERKLEIDCFLSILNDITKKHVDIIEIGSGWGEWCLATAGVVNGRLFNAKPSEYDCYAIEADPDNRYLTEQHFAKHKLHGFVEWGAVSDKVGTCLFNVKGVPFGQNITFQGLIRGSNIITSLWGLYRMVLGKVTTVPQITIDWFFSNYDISHIDIVQMDIQGAEVRAIKGAENSINKSKIDYFIIGTHHSSINYQLMDLLEHKYDLVVNELPKTEQCPVDGLQVYKRRGLI